MEGPIILVPSFYADSKTTPPSGGLLSRSQSGSQNMESKSRSELQTASGVAEALRPLGRYPPFSWALSVLTAVYDAVVRVIDTLEMGNLIEEINEHSLRSALRAVGIDAFMRITVESPSQLP